MSSFDIQTIWSSRRGNTPNPHPKAQRPTATPDRIHALRRGRTGTPETSLIAVFTPPKALCCRRTEYLQRGRTECTPYAVAGQGPHGRR
eukprot:13699215-Heterocapsa_arctica.AAC.1